jgi:hypothetical protein
VCTIGKNLRNAQRWNRYTYSANNPLKFVDPDGQEYVNATGMELANRVLSRNAVMSPSASPTGQRIVGNVKAEPERVTVNVNSQAKFQLVDSFGKHVAGSERVVDPSQGKATVNQLASQAKPGERVAPVGGEYTPTGSGSDGGVGSSTITIYAGSKDFSTEGQAQTEDQFVESQFVHESAHAEGPAPTAKTEQQVKQEEKDSQKESGYP